MNSVKYLYAAYIATWLIHCVYLGSLVSQYRRLRERIRDLDKGK
jgi:CcmD family protein